MCWAANPLSCESYECMLDEWYGFCSLEYIPCQIIKITLTMQLKARVTCIAWHIICVGGIFAL